MTVEFKPILKLDTMYGHCDELKIEIREMNLIATVGITERPALSAEPSPSALRRRTAIIRRC